MPHMSIEYSPGMEENADMAAFCATIHDAMRAEAIFPLAGIRVRAYRADHAIVADGLPENGFVALTLTVGAGRATEVLQEVGNRIFAAAKAALAEPLSTTHFALSLQIRVTDPDLSWKATPIHQRLSKPE